MLIQQLWHKLDVKLIVDEKINSVGYQVRCLVAHSIILIILVEAKNHRHKAEDSCICSAFKSFNAH